VGTLAAMKTKPKPRARRMWANYYQMPWNPTLHRVRRLALVSRGHKCEGTIPVAVIPLHDLTTLGDSMVSALVAIGVLPRARAKKGRK
jgi:hypothetical protein